MYRSFFILIFLSQIPFLALAQYEESVCDSLYMEWSNPVGFADYPRPEIVGGIKSLYSNLVYPESAISEGLEESAMVWILISKKGTPKCIRFIKLENEVFKGSIISAIEKQKFKPLIIRNSPIDASLVIPFNFKLK
ncbi:MAG: energy transducer TonB [Balneolaceae bacterium]|nr:energy transducer TonB [Balneolaceae bacterium]